MDRGAAFETVRPYMHGPRRENPSSSGVGSWGFSLI